MRFWDLSALDSGVPVADADRGMPDSGPVDSDRLTHIVSETRHWRIGPTGPETLHRFALTSA